MIKRFEKFLRKKRLALSPKKSKIAVFGREGGRAKRREWSWKEKR